MNQNNNQINIETIQPIEADILSYIKNGINTLDLLVEKSKHSETSIQNVLTQLVSNNTLNLKRDKYELAVPIDPYEYVILEGNILLPCSIIRIPEKNIMYVTRGNWYKFPIDFDTKRIIWNIKFANEKSSTLADLIKTSVLKERKSKIKHLPEYDGIRNKILPYSKDIGLFITAVGENQTSVNVIFRIRFDNAFNTVYNGFTVPTEISTQELLSELNKPLDERNYTENIKLNKLYSIDDFIFAKNEIPISFEDGKITYVKITGVRNGYELTYYSFDGITQSSKKLEVEIFDNLFDLTEKFRNLFEHYAGQILAKSDFYIELDD